jgi:hypothetical protein
MGKLRFFIIAIMFGISACSTSMITQISRVPEGEQTTPGDVQPSSLSPTPLTETPTRTISPIDVDDRCRRNDHVSGTLLLGSGVPGDVDIYLAKFECDVNIPKCHLDFILIVSDQGADLADDMVAFDSNPVGSADGEWVAFISDRATPNQGDDIYIVSRDGQNLKRLTYEEGTMLDLDWSPDGNFLLYSKQTEVGTTISIVQINSGISTQLNMQTPWNLYPRWSPDGQKIAYLAGDTRGQRPSATNIYNLELNAQQDFFTGEEINEYPPSWSPMGMLLMISIRGSEGSSLAILDIAVGEYTMLNTGSLDATQPIWSPSGEMIAFVGSEGEYSDIYLLDDDRGKLVNLTRMNSINIRPQWGTSEEYIIYTVLIGDNEQIRVLSPYNCWPEIDLDIPFRVWSVDVWE